MKTHARYIIANTDRFITRGTSPSSFFMLRDQSPTPKENLKYLFKDSHIIFRMRVEKLGTLSKTTTKDEAQSLRVMLETLIQTKGILQQIK